MDIASVLLRAGERHPERVVLQVPETGETYTTQELVDTGRGIADGLRSRFDIDAATIGLYTENCAGAFTTLVAAWLRGNPVCEIKPRTTADNLPYFVEDGEVDVLVYHHTRQERVEAVRDTLDVAFVQIGGEAPDWAVLLSDLAAEPVRRDVTVDPETIATIGYTSGTTGKPKGVPYTHERLFHTVLILLIRNEVVEHDQVCLIYPYYGVGNLEFLACLMVGATLVLPQDSSPENVVRIIEEESITSIGGVPTQLKVLAEAAAESEYDTSSLRYVHTGSGLMTDTVYDLVKQELCETICTSYGSSEAAETTYSLEDSIAIGRPQPFQRVRLVEPGSNDPEKQVDGVGELIVAADGPTVFDGYWKKPEKTEAVLHDGWYFTGDVVEQDDEGRFWFRGRTDDMIISGGVNIAPGAVENTLLQHDAVEHVGVIGVPDEQWGQKVVAVIEAREDVSEKDLDQHCKQSSLEDFKRPKDYLFIESMPLTKTGGVKRAALRQRWDER